MDKNMIHIDDLVRKRLSGGEEPEISGSWLRMRELLDKEMPEKKRVAGYYNWRRMFGAAAGLVLLSALTVGGYNLVTSTRFGNVDEKAVAAAVNSKVKLTEGTSANQHSMHKTDASKETGGQSSITENEVVSADKIAITTSEKAATVITSEHNKMSSEARASQKHVPDNKVRNSVDNQVKGADHVAIAMGTSVSHNANNIRPGDGSNPLIPKKANSLPVAANNTTGISHTTVPLQKVDVSLTNDSENIKDNVALRDNKSSSNTNYSSGNTASSKTMSNRNSEPSGLQPKQNQNSAVSAKSSGSVTPAPGQPDQPKDSLDKLTVVQRLTINPLTRVGKLTADTVSVERLAIDRAQFTALNDVAKAGADVSNGNITPAAAATTAASEADAIAANGLVSLSNYKVQSKRTTKWNARSFDEVVRDVKFNLAQMIFYPGISIGGNSYMFGANNLSGFQLGLFGLFAFGESWSAMGELKYIHRFNGGGTLRDDYYELRSTPGSGYVRAKVEHFFKFTSLQSIEMPLALRYAAGRLNVFGGINLAYHFAVNAEEITLHAPDTAFKPAPSGLVKANPEVSYHDFRARFALGGLAGISYEVTPSLQLDFRATKGFWDNGYGLGAERVSREFYNAPSMQISIFYRFNQRNQIPKAK